eukprot:928302-Alexandrium_andersonii.AAC.1
MGPLALIGLAIWAFGVWHGGWGTWVIAFMGAAISTASAVRAWIERASVGPPGPVARRPPRTLGAGLRPAA